MNLFDLLRHYLNPEESERFAEWAFGAEHESLRSSLEIITAWNERHSYLYKAKRSNTMHDDIEIMIEIWIKNAK